MDTDRPVGLMPISSPFCVPRQTSRTATLLPSASMSSIDRCRSGKAERTIVTVRFKPTLSRGDVRRGCMIDEVVGDQLVDRR
jgi:hypothetical protein